MRNIILILGFILSIPTLSQGQPFGELLPRIQKAAFDSARGTGLLLQRTNTSYIKARQALYTIRPIILTPGPRYGELIRPVALPVHTITPHLHFENPTAVYPGIPFLTSDEQVEQYLISRNNRAIFNELKHLADHSEKIANHMSTFRQEIARCEQPTQQIPWMVNRIDPNINYLFVGEMHNVPEVRRSMAQLLQGLRQRFPKREIIVFTELLTSHISTEEIWKSAILQPTPEDRMELVKQFEKLGEYHLGRDVWETIQSNRIEVVGLEPSFVWDNSNATLIAEDPQDGQNLMLWWTDEGSRLRHMHWEQRINEWRQQHPNALFVIHGGAEHFSYFSSSAISTHFPREQRLTVNLFPQKVLMQDAAGNHVEVKDNLGWFAEITQNQFPQNTLYWQTEKSASLSGFDYQLRVPPLR